MFNNDLELNISGKKCSRINNFVLIGSHQIKDKEDFLFSIYKNNDFEKFDEPKRFEVEKKGKIKIPKENFDKNEVLIIQSTLYSEFLMKSVLLISLEGCSYKLWLNNELKGVFLFGGGGIVISEIHCGINNLTIELFNINSNCSLSARISDFNYEKSIAHFGFNDDNYLIKNKKIQFIIESADLRNENKLEFLLISKDVTRLTNKADVKLSFYNLKREIIYSFLGSINKKIKIDMNKIKRVEDLDDPIVTCEIEAILSDGTEYFQDINFIIRDFSGILDIIKLKLSMYETQSCFDDYLINIKKIISIFEETMNSELTIPHADLYYFNLKNLLSMIYYLEKDIDYKSYISSPGVKDIYYKSKLDGKIDKYLISIPHIEETNEKLPLIINFPEGRYSDLSIVRSSSSSLKFIFADISGKGVTLGSYIGEAAILEVIEKIIEDFPIDTRKIYLTGYSNGAYTSWSLCQNYPHMFAGIVSFSGRPYFPNLMNLSNNLIFNISSNLDDLYQDAFLAPSERLNSSERYNPVLLEELVHSDFWFVQLNSRFLELLKMDLNFTFPKEIYFRTERSRHNKTFHFEIIEASTSSDFSEIKACFLDDREIILNSKNVNVLKINFPVWFEKKTFKIVYNQNIYNINGVDNDFILLNLMGNTLSLLNVTFPIQSNRIYGMGLLDIFMDSVEIILPEKFNQDKDEDIVTKTAKKFSSPVTNGWDTKIYIEYPVKKSSTIRLENNNSNIIVIHLNDFDFIDEIIEYLPIKTNSIGYIQDGNIQIGNYCIMQIFQNPFNKRNKVMVLSSNDIGYFNKFIFTRRIVIPGYVNGIHPYLNADAIILNDSGYHVIK